MRLPAAVQLPEVIPPLLQPPAMKALRDRASGVDWAGRAPHAEGPARQRLGKGKRLRAFAFAGFVVLGPPLRERPPGRRISGGVPAFTCCWAGIVPLRPAVPPESILWTVGRLALRRWSGWPDATEGQRTASTVLHPDLAAHRSRRFALTHPAQRRNGLRWPEVLPLGYDTLYELPP